MSYILDALKRADADRERGQVPSLHSQNPLPVAEDTSRRGRIAAGLGLTLVAIVALAVFWFHSAGQTAAPSPIPANDPQPAADTSVAQPGPAAVASATASVLPPLHPPPAPILAPEPPIPQPTSSRMAHLAKASTEGENGTVDSEDLVDTEDPDAKDPTTHTGPAPVLLPPPPKPAPKRAVQASTTATAHAGLPPGITVSGASYSENPEHRMLIVNGKVVHEGEDIQPGLRVEAIGAHTAVLKHNGIFYNIRY